MNTLRFVRIVVLAALAGASARTEPDPWVTLRFLSGKWEGPVTGRPGKGVTSREYRFDLDGRFLSGRSKTVFEPKSPGGKSEVHEEFGIYSYDRALKKIVLRQFHLEGFVNEYTLDSTGADGKLLEFTTVRIENLAAGWRARESIHIVSPDEFVETFFLAAPGKDFEVFVETRLKRVK